MTAPHAALALDTPPTVIGTHRPLRFELISAPGVIPDDVRLAMREAAIYGKMFARELDQFEGRPKPEFLAALDAKIVERVGDSGPGSAMLIETAFLVGGVETVRDPSWGGIEGYRPHTLGIRAQHVLTRARLAFNDDLVNDLWDAHAVVGVDQGEWRKTLTGAFRAATAARKLAFGRIVYLPTVDEDREKIDLIVFDGTNEGLTVQVKSVDDPGFCLAEILEEPRGGNLNLKQVGELGDGRRLRERDAQDYGICRKLWLSTANFNKHYGVNYRPAMAYIGKRQ